MSSDDSPSGARFSRAAFLAALLAFGAARPARAQTVAPPITDNRYTLQFNQGPVTSATRMIGLGGAYAALAEYTEGVYANSAASAVRVPWSVTRFDYDLSPSVTVPGAFSHTDFENRGRVGATNRFDNAVNVGLGLSAQYGPFGATVSFDYSSFALQRGEKASQQAEAKIGLHRAIASLGYSLFGGQLLVGGGFRSAYAGVVDGLPNFSSFGLAGHAGAIYAPAALPFRFGASYRGTVEVDKIRGVETRNDGSEVASGRILPDRAVLPWELQMGVMVGLGGYPENGHWIDPDDDEAPVRRKLAAARAERGLSQARALAAAPAAVQAELAVRLEREEQDKRAAEDAELERALEFLERKRLARFESWRRQGVMVVADLLFTGSSSRPSVGVEDFLDQRLVSFGESHTLSPRLGVETEVVPHFMKVRTGTYVEPSRFRDGTARSHFTAGLDFRLFVFNPLGLLSKAPMRLRLVGDVAPRYSNFGFALGTWH